MSVDLSVTKPSVVVMQTDLFFFFVCLTYLSKCVFAFSTALQFMCKNCYLDELLTTNVQAVNSSKHTQKQVVKTPTYHLDVCVCDYSGYRNVFTFS